MTHSCNELRELMMAEGLRGRPLSREVESRVGACESCARWVASFERQVAALVELPRRQVPASLEGRVVAALHQGYREDRAISELSQVGGPGAPAELDASLEDLFSELRAEGLLAAPEVPSELETRVDEDLRDLPGAISAHMLGKLESLSAPDSLAARIEADLAASQGTQAPRTLSLTVKRRLAAGLAAAAGLAIWAGLGQNTELVSPPALTPLVVISVDAGSDLSPAARRLFNSLTGGALSAHERVRVQREEAIANSGLAARRGARGATVGGGSSAALGGGASGANQASALSGSQQNPGTRTVGGSHSGNQALTSGGAPPLFDQIASAPLVVATRGVRRIQMFFPRNSHSGYSSDLEYLEEIATDGLGKYAILPGAVVTPNLSSTSLAEFQLLQSGREGFFFHSRDFSIRDAALFGQNYKVTDTGLQMTVCGVNVTVFDVSRLDGGGHVYRLGIDSSTGIILFQEVTGHDGVPISRLTYESFAYNADLSDVELRDGASVWVPFDINNSAALGFRMMHPTAPPTGYSFQGAGLLTGFANGSETWAQLTYGDGVDEVFFAFSTTEPSQMLSISGKGDTLRSMNLGPWTMIEGNIRGTKTIAVGKVDEAELLLMLQSALETR
jgi:hypothetical protein